jgi:DNA invertase Pin-like site-specific DNA recombinase
VSGGNPRDPTALYAYSNCKEGLPARRSLASLGRALFQMLGVFAEFERSIIQERIHAGLARARTKGVRLGRPPAVERLAERQIIAARAATPEKSTRAIARELGVSERHVRRVLA